MDGTEMLQQAILAGVTEDSREDYGEVAGEHVMALAQERGLATRHQAVYDLVVHHAALADIVTTATRKAGSPAWRPAGEGVGGWVSGCTTDASGAELRRIVMVSAWSDERHRSEARSWYSLGEVCHFELPMKQIVVVLGQSRDGKRHGPFSKGFLHPENHELRFRRKEKSSHATFNARWQQVWREDVGGGIPGAKWLQSMLKDDILRDVLFTVDIPVPGKTEVERVREMAKRKMDAIRSTASLPDGNLSTCFWPVECVFQPECHGDGKLQRDRFVKLV